MNWLRRCHLYLSIFFTPLLVLFIVTGWWQTTTIDRNKGNGFGQTQIEKLSTIHIDQYYPVDGVKRYKTAAFKQLTVALCVGLLATILLGVVLAFRSMRDRRGAILVLILGILVPAFLLWWGQHSH